MANKNYVRSEAEILFRAKQQRRQELASLPFEEKIRILLELQKISRDVQNSKGKEEPHVWDIST